MSISDPAGPVITDAIDVGHLGLFLISDPDQAPELHIREGQNSINVGAPETAAALAAALVSIAPSDVALPVGVSSRADRTRPDALDRGQRATALAEAQTTECGVPGCDRELHSPHDKPSEWVHRIARRQHFGMDVELSVEPGGAVLADLFYKVGRSFDAEGLRAFATTLQLQAAALHEDADILEQRARRVERI